MREVGEFLEGTRPRSGITGWSMMLSERRTKHPNVYLRSVLLGPSVSKASVPSVCIVGGDPGYAKTRGKFGRIVFSSGSRRRATTDQAWPVPDARQWRQSDILKFYYVCFRWTRKRWACFTPYKLVLFSFVCLFLPCDYRWFWMCSMCKDATAILYFKFRFDNSERMMEEANTFYYIPVHTSLDLGGSLCGPVYAVRK